MFQLGNFCEMDVRIYQLVKILNRKDRHNKFNTEHHQLRHYLEVHYSTIPAFF